MQTSFKCFICLTLAGCTAFGQKVTVDWPTKKITSQPSRVEKDTMATVEVDQVNDLMYTYSISYQLKPLTISDFTSIANAFSIAAGKAPAGESAAACDFSDVLNSQKALADAESAFLQTPATNPECSASKPCDITLGAAVSLWNKNVQPKLDAAKAALGKFTAACSSPNYSSSIKSASDAIGAAEAKIASSHSIIKANAIPLSPENTTSLVVVQLWMGTPTVNGSYSVDIQTSNYRLTLSAGALFSEVQNRSYTSSSAPNAAGTGTTNILAVGGLSRFNPTAVALLNYELPFADWERFGFALSTGPVFRLGSKSDATSFGYFAGMSIHLYHRFYISPGFHLGQFADFPAGFSQANQPVPSGLSTPTAITRWTWRFGFGLSYKAKDFSQFGLTGSVNPTDSATTGK